MGYLKERLTKAKASLPAFSRTPKIGLILGSGLAGVADAIDISETISTEDIEGLCRSTAPSHAGNLIVGTLFGNDIAVLNGRVHLYEGVSALDVAMPVYLLQAIGVETLIITNASGGLNPAFDAGSVAMITDHINLTGNNPLIGIDEPDIGVRFPDMSKAYPAALQDIARASADKAGVALGEGIYVGVTGPSLETSAERRYFRQAGGDMVGMSTIMEVIAANHCGMDVLGLSVITNKATGEADQQPDTLEDVLHHAKIGGDKLSRILGQVLQKF